MNKIIKMVIIKIVMSIKTSTKTINKMEIEVFRCIRAIKTTIMEIKTTANMTNKKMTVKFIKIMKIIIKMKK